MTRASLRVRLGAALLAAVVLAGGTPGAAQPRRLPRLQGVADLKSWFNANRSHLKAILLLSPT